MANNTEDTTPQGNIKQEYSVASAGLNLDNSVNQVPNGKLTYALNASIENFNDTSINYQNEQGNEFCVSFPEDYVLIGQHFIPEKEKHIYFIVNSKTNNSQIGFMDNNDCIYQTLVNSPCLNFKIDYPVHKVAHRIGNCITEIYWTDGLNPRRYLDIENIPWKLLSGTSLCNPVYDIGNLDCNQLKIQPDFNIPQINVLDITTGGALISGTYQFAAQYSDASGNPYTSYYSITNPTPIADVEITTQNFNYPVGKSIVLDVSNLDSTGQFTYFNIAVIKTINAITSVELIGTYSIGSTTENITYTGQTVDDIRLSINDIFEKFPYYDIAEDLTTAQDVLIWSGLTSDDRLNYQHIASSISLKWETYKIPKTENYSNELNATNLRSYLRDEVYAFEIAFLLKNGKQTDGFHIPGRTITTDDEVIIYPTNEDFIGEPDIITGGQPRWKIYNTASYIGLSTSTEKIGNTTPYKYGEFAYWESDQTYPCNIDVWGDLADQPIRHHKFPDVLVSPIYDSPVFTGVADITMGNNDVFPIGVKVDLSQISTLIANSNLTAEQKDDIVGYKIIRGDRATNKSIIGKGILRNVGTYKKENQDYYYPNYPYNDISQDPFLNATNNAWSQECEPFEVNVLQLVDVDAIGTPCLKVRYTNCDNNKEANIAYYELGKVTLCSIGKPIITSVGVTNSVYYNRGSGGTFTVIIRPENIGTVGYLNYDVYKVFIQSGFQRKYAFNFDDPICGTDISFNSFTGAGQSWVVPVRVDTLPFCIAGKCSNMRMEKLIQYENRVLTCGSESSITPISNNQSLSYRQIFNSPETSFGQPFLGDVLKLENVMFGKGKAHFVEVENNAKYKLLTEEAQRDALDLSADLGRITNPFSAQAMFAAYQAYLTIYVNGITRKNYAYSYNSIADYNNSMAIPNDLGVKQRPINTARYLIPGVQSTGNDSTDFPINNYQRESSVYIKTKGELGEDEPTIAALPFPSKSPFMVSGGSSIIEDKSRYTISDIGSCATPAKENDIQVVSYYASLKNTFVNQWGQIYSYKTIDTGFQHMFNSSSIISTVFGGDTFISRFAFKTKLPFFFDNRVNAPDDSDIFYDEIGNIAYPKYWHSARSILSDYSIDTDEALPSSMTNFISYKAHNFDCPNDQEPKENNPSRTFYDGYFYMFAYGIPNFYCESSYNVDLRQAFNNKEGDFYPHVNNNIPDKWVQENFVSINNDNTYYYNTTYSKQNKENNFTHLPADWKNNLCFTHYPFRAIYSDLQSTDSDNRVNNWLIYRAISYFDFPQNYGNLISVDGIQNKAILARFENKSLLYNNLLTIDTSNPQAAYLGNPNLFKGAPPIDFAETDLGYVGSQNKFLLKIPQGQITIDAKRGQVFLIQGTQVEDLSALGSGMNRFFTDHLAFEILRYFPETDTDNHFNGVGLHGVYDSKFDRVIITKLDYIPLDTNIKYDLEAKRFYLDTDASISYNFEPYETYDFTDTITRNDYTYFYGGFTGYNNGTYFQNSSNIIKINSDTSVDTSFNVGNGITQPVYSNFSITEQLDKKIIVCGLFSNYNNQQVYNITRLNIDGSIDASFVTGSGFNNFTTNASVNNVGKIIVTGLFSNYNGVFQPRIARLNSNGSVDTSFITGSGFNNTTIDTLINLDDSMYITGYFTSYNDVLVSRGIIKLLDDGTIDNSFIGGTGFNVGNNQPICMTRIEGESSFYAFGHFTTYKGITYTHAIKLQSNGDVDTSFNPGLGFNNNDVIAAEIVWGNKIYITGYFTSYNGVYSPSNIILNADGSVYYANTENYYALFILGNNVYGQKLDETIKKVFSNVPEVDTRMYIELTDPTYFCNKSWTMSYHMNAKAWISFHSYIPNFYIGENNFFYSGLNGCCVDFDFVAGELIPTPSTTTTTTSSTSSTTTTTTTAAIYDCRLVGSAILVLPPTTTTTTTSSTTTTTTTAPLICTSFTATTSSTTILDIGYTDCNSIEQIINIGGSAGSEVSFCIYDGIDYDPGQITIVENGACLYCDLEGTAVEQFTTTTTTTTAYIPVTGLTWNLVDNVTGVSTCQPAGWIVSNSNLNIRYDIANSQNCGGTCSIRQTGTATATITVGGVNTYLNLDFNGIGEAEQSAFEKIDFFLNGPSYSNVKLADAHAPGGGLGCVMGQVIKQYYVPSPYLLTAGNTYTFTINFDTADALYHVDAYYEVNLLFT